MIFKVLTHNQTVAVYFLLEITYKNNKTFSVVRFASFLCVEERLFGHILILKKVLWPLLQNSLTSLNFSTIPLWQYYKNSLTNELISFSSIIVPDNNQTQSFQKNWKIGERKIPLIFLWDYLKSQWNKCVVYWPAFIRFNTKIQLVLVETAMKIKTKKSFFLFCKFIRLSK